MKSSQIYILMVLLSNVFKTSTLVNAKPQTECITVCRWRDMMRMLLEACGQPGYANNNMPSTGRNRRSAANGGKRFGEMKARQESYIGALNRDILSSEDFRYVHVPGLSRKLEIYKKRFMQFDADHSGDIDFFELKQMLESLGQPRTHLEAKRLLADADKRGQGAINYRDFVDMLLGNGLGVGVVFTEEEDVEPVPTSKLKKKRQAPKPPKQKTVSFEDDPKPAVQRVREPPPGELIDKDEVETQVFTAEPDLPGDPPPYELTNSSYETGTAVQSPPPQPAPARRPLPVITTDVLPRRSQERADGGTVTEVVPPPSAAPQTTSTQQSAPRSLPSLHTNSTLPPPSVHQTAPHSHTPRGVSHTTTSAVPAPQVYPYTSPQQMHQMHQPVQHTSPAAQTVQAYIPCNVPGCTQCPVYPQQVYAQAQVYGSQVLPQVVNGYCSCPACVSPAVGQVAYSCQTPGCNCQQTTGHHGYQATGQYMQHALIDKMGAVTLTQ